MASFPVINMKKLEGDKRGAAMDCLHDACEHWGFFEVLTIDQHIHIIYLNLC